jgi:hypothetical protein
MADAALLAYLQELMTSYDSTISTTAGSSFRTRVIDPFLSRIGDSPLDLDLETFLAERVAEEVPDLDTGSNSGIRDLVIRPMSVMLEPLRREINSIKIGQSLNDYESMTRPELNSLLGNFFLSIQEGSLATGTVRVYYSTPQTSTVSTLAKFLTEGGLIYHASSVVSISGVDMAFQQEGSYYYLDVPVQASEAGEKYNIPAGGIVQLDGVVGPIKVTNKLAFTSASEDETAAEAVARAQDSITIRNLATSRGIKTLISSQYPAIDTIEVVGFGDTHMIRDVVDGPFTVGGVPGGFEGAKTLTSATSIHIGGKTDAYVLQSSPVASSIDITNITDVGTRICRSESGYTSAVDSYEFYDNRGWFATYSVKVGDRIRLGDTLYTIQAPITETTLTVTSGSGYLPTGLTDQNYEIVRFDDLRIDVPLYDLVAVDSDGVSIADGEGTYVQPVPGSLSREALTDSDGTYVAKTTNVCASNINLPVMRVKSVGLLDPTALTSLGTYAPCSDILLVTAKDTFSGGTGVARIYFKDAVSCAVTTGTIGTYPIFNYEGMSYTPSPIVTSAASALAGAGTGILELGSTATNDITLYYGVTKENLTAAQKVVAGDYIVWNVVSPASGGTGDISGGHDGGPVQIASIADVDHATTGHQVKLTLRHDADPDIPNALAGSAGTIRGFEIVRGRGYQAMLKDSTTGLYYFDVGISQMAGSAKNPGEGDSFGVGHATTGAFDDFWVEGYRLKSSAEGTAFSIREAPYLELTPYILGERLTKASTAYAFRVSYDYTDTLGLIQEYVDSDDNRIVSEDLLVKHFLPAMVRGSIEGTGLTAAVGLSTITSAISEIAPTGDIEISDIVGALYAAGATQVTMPITMVLIHHGQDRKVTATILKDSATANRVQKFIPDPDNLTFTVKS